MWSAYTSRRTVLTLAGPRPLRLHVRRCRNRACRRFGLPYRPEAEGRSRCRARVRAGRDRLAGGCGTGTPERARGPPGLAPRPVCERTVTNLLDRYDELLALSLSDAGRLRAITARPGG